MSEARSGAGTSAPTVLRMILGRRLHDMRQSAGASLADAARALRVTPLTIRRLEKAEVALKPLYVEKLLQTYGSGQQEIDEFVALAEQANKPGWWHAYRDVLPTWFTAYVSLETGAGTLRTYEPHYVTGLLQTPPTPAASWAEAFRTAPTRSWSAASACGCAGRACWSGRTRPPSGWSWRKRSCTGSSAVRT